MPAVRTIDTHAHILNDETMRLLQKEAPKIGPTLKDSKADPTVLTVAGVPYHPFPLGGREIENRLPEMDATAAAVQLLSAPPHTYYYDQEPSLGATLSAIQNEQIAKHVRDKSDRFMGIATLPLQAPEKAAAELSR